MAKALGNCEVSKADILSPGRFSGIHFALGYMIVL